MSINLKPEIYISWIPRGQIEVKPEIYASIILAPHLETISADTSRKVSNTENILVDTFRKVGNVETVQGDLFRKINKTEIISTDSFRRIGKVENIFADTSRTINFAENISGDTRRKISNVEKIIADTLREVETDLIEIVADTLIRNACSENIPADTLRKIVSSEIISADTFRKINQSTEIIADTFLQVGNNEKIFADTKLVTSNLENIFADTEIIIKNIEIISADTERNIFEFISADTFRQIVKLEKIVADTNKRIPHKLLYTINSPLQNTFKDYGLTSLNITLQEKTLSDTYQLETVQEMEINDAVTGKFLDYDFKFLVEETSRQETQTVKGMYDKDELLFTQIKDSGVVKLVYEIDDEIIEQWGYEIYKKRIVKEFDGENDVVYVTPTASDFINKIANYLGYSSNIRIEDFTPSNLNGEIDITYSNLLSNVFGWTSQVPQRQINVFIRGGVLNCIQRGMEESVFDISNLPHSRPIVNKKLLRTMWQCQSDSADNSDDDDDERPFTGTISFSPAIGVENSLTYQSGFLTTEITRTLTEDLKVNSTVHYTYWTRLVDSDEETYLIKKISNTETENLKDKEKTIDKTTTEYQYKQLQKNEIYLLSEEEETIRQNYSRDYGKSGTYSTVWKLDDEETISRRTLHSPLGNGWYGQAVYEKGVLVGSNISQGKPGNRVSPYTLKQINQFTHTTSIQIKSDGTPLSPVEDKDFPVVEKDIKKACADAYEWLNRKIQEEISVDIIDRVVKGVPNLLHVIDFTERIKLDGKEYFLVSNNISFTPRKFIQRLNLIRWF